MLSKQKMNHMIKRVLLSLRVHPHLSQIVPVTSPQRTWVPVTTATSVFYLVTLVLTDHICHLVCLFPDTLREVDMLK